MAKELAQDDDLRVIFWTQAQSQIGINVRHYHVNAIVPVLTDVQAAQFLADTFAAAYQGVMGSDAIFAGVSVLILPAAANVQVYSIRTNLAGIGIGDLLPREVAGLISLRTQKPGRGGRGRMYIPFPSEGFNAEDGHPTDTYMTNLGVLRDLSDDVLEIDPLMPGNLTLAPTIRSTTAPAGFPVVSFSLIRQLWASMRSRGDYSSLDILPF